MNTEHTTGAGTAGSDAAPQGEVRRRLIGVWRLRSCCRIFEGGRTEQPFGEDPVGRITYDVQGRMSAMLMRRGRQSHALPGSGLQQATAEELREVVAGFIAYMGTFDVDESSQTVIHHVQASLFPDWVGTDQRRAYRFEDNLLILRRATAESEDELVWEREVSAQTAV